MTDYFVSDTDLTSVANAIRTKGGTSAQLSFPDGFNEAIANISAGGTDVSDTTATAADVVAGKYFYTSAGVRTQGSMAVYAGEYHVSGYTVSISLTNPFPIGVEEFVSCVVYQINSTHLDEFGFYDDLTEIGSINSPTGSTSVKVADTAFAIMVCGDSTGMGVSPGTVQVTGDVVELGFQPKPYPDIAYLNLSFTVAGNGTITIDGIDWNDD